MRRGGVWLSVYEHSLVIAFTVLFLGSFVGHAVAGAHEYSAEQHEHSAAGISPWQFVRTSEFWFQSFQNWQSEFLAVGTIVVLSVFLRQRGSAESKPVHAPHRRPATTELDRRGRPAPLTVNDRARGARGGVHVVS